MPEHGGEADRQNDRKIFPSGRLPHEQRRDQRRRQHQDRRQEDDLAGIVLARELLQEHGDEARAHGVEDCAGLPEAKAIGPRPQNDHRADEADDQCRPAANAHLLAEKDDGAERPEQGREKSDRRHFCHGDEGERIEPRRHRENRDADAHAVEMNGIGAQERAPAPHQHRHEKERRRDIAQKDHLERMHAHERRLARAGSEDGEQRHGGRDPEHRADRIVPDERARVARSCWGWRARRGLLALVFRHPCPLRLSQAMSNRRRGGLSQCTPRMTETRPPMCRAAMRGTLPL